MQNKNWGKESKHTYSAALSTNFVAFAAEMRISCPWWLVTVDKGVGVVVTNEVDNGRKLDSENKI